MGFIGNLPAKGDPGPAGLTGPAGPGLDVTTTFNQVAPAAVWDVTHNLGRFPSVTVVDSAGTEMEGNVDYLDANSIHLTFSAAFAGVCYLN